jgi:flavin-dependent dehydrogenase
MLRGFMENSDRTGQWDAIVIGGALSGAATATLLLRRNPKWRILILERSERFTRRVGESTVEISAYFLGRVLGLTDHLVQHHLVKQGMRFWFSNGQAGSLAECSETGPAYNVRLPGYQVDRAVLDEEVLQRVVAAGAELRRPVKVTDVILREGGQQQVTWTDAAGTSVQGQARWLIDASGFAAVLARKQGWLKLNEAHPIAACWGRWQGVKSWDSRELREKFPAWADRTQAVRLTATNHVVGRGWWSWWIPLRGGDMSVGVVYDQRMVELPPGENLGERLRAFLMQHPAAREIFADAKVAPGDMHYRSNCAYASTRMAGNGYVLVGDAAAFLDPFYSPGMDWISFTATGAADLVDGCLRGRPAAERAALYQERFTLCYERWFDALYRNKYFYMGDYELMTLAFRLDLGIYYLGVVSQPMKHGEKTLGVPAFARRGSGWAARLISLYNRRFAAIAQARHARGTWGRRNAGHYFPFVSYQIDRRLLWRVLWTLTLWGRLEIVEGWRTWFRPVPEPGLSRA